MQTDVIVLGAGLAGMTAALAAEQAGARVLLLDRGPIGVGTNSALSNAGFAGPVSAERADEYVALVLEVGKRLNRVAYVRRVAHEAPAAVAMLESLGLDLWRAPGRWTVRPSDGEIPGVLLVRTVAARLAGRERVVSTPGVYVRDLLRNAQRGIVGVRGVDLEGRAREIHAASVILACGGAGAIYARHDNQSSMMGQGYRLAASAGLDLHDMEFVQWYPLVLDEPAMPRSIMYPPYPPGFRLIDASGADLAETHGLGNVRDAVIRRRDAFSAMLAGEYAAGRPVSVDLRAVPDEHWEAHPLRLLKRFKRECQERPIRVSPAVHFFMGGVAIGEEAQTRIDGLFACGEMVWGMHGANRMAGNALMECLVSGRLAGLGAARWARAHPDATAGPIVPVGGEEACGFERVDLRQVRRRLREVAWARAGIARSGEGMAAGLREAEALWRTIRAARADTAQEQILRADLLSGAFTLRAVLACGLGRLESRGSFLREDHPTQDDGAWMKNSRLRWDAVSDRFEVDYVPVESD